MRAIFMTHLVSLRTESYAEGVKIHMFTGNKYISDQGNVI